MDERSEQINGPINVIRLEGNINSIKKIIYVFMDVHMPVNMQTTCESIYSEDIVKYLATNFKNLNSSDKTYDFFLEIYPTTLQNIKYGYDYSMDVNLKEKYAWEIFKFFKKIFVYDPDKNKVLRSNIFKNLRLHYIDIRAYFLVDKFYMDGIMNIASYMWKNENINLEGLSKIINLLKLFATQCNAVSEIFMREQKKPQKKQIIHPIDPRTFLSPKEIMEYVEYLTYKIFGIYQHDNVRKKLEKWKNIIGKDIKELSTNAENIIKDFIEIGNTVDYNENRLTSDTRLGRNQYGYGISPFTMHDMLEHMFKVLIDLNSKYAEIFVLLVDIYFLRRFLDKDYVTNAISYTGAAHSCFYINTLVKDFGFKITHVSYSKNKDINSIVQKIDYEEVAGEFFPPIFSQCSDMSSFPKNFE